MWPKWAIAPPYLAALSWKVFEAILAQTHLNRPELL